MGQSPESPETPEAPDARDLPPLRLIAGAAIADGRIAFALGAPPRWQRIPTYTLVPLELPGGELHESMADMEAARRALHELGLAVEIVSSPWTYAPSPAHAIDRHRWEGAEPAPLLALARKQPVERPDGMALRPVAVRVYRARLAATTPGHADPNAERRLWLTPEQVRALVRGVALADLRALIGRDAATLDWLPEDALIYLPAEYGERYLLRVLAKYGDQALFG